MSALRNVLAVVVLLSPAVAAAEGEACFRDTECVGAERCVESACAADASLPSCTDDDDCEEGGTVCDDGFCKLEGVVCTNPAGTCWVEGGGGRCHCGNGEDSGWSGGYNPDDPPEPKTDEEQQLACMEELIESCGEDPPALPDTCVGEVLAHCEAFVEQEDALLQLCGEDVNDVNIGRVGACCDSYADEPYAAYRECVLAIELGDTCPGDAWGECEGDGGGANDQEGDPASGEDDDDGASKAGCRIAGSDPAWALFALFGLAARRRARSKPRT